MASISIIWHFQIWSICKAMFIITNHMQHIFQFSKMTLHPLKSTQFVLSQIDLIEQKKNVCMSFAWLLLAQDSLHHNELECSMCYSLNIRHRWCSHMSVTISQDASRLWNFYKNIYYTLACTCCILVKIDIVLYVVTILYSVWV